MSYLVLARKWRPNAFSNVVGQEHVLKALINGLDQNRLHHAFLFSGTRGVGKTTLARIFAKSLNCEQGVSSTPCGECQSCQEVDAGRFVDLIEVDAASRTKVDDTRELLDNVQYAPSRGRYKVYLIDEVHMLSTSSFNALLKTLEEPPPHVKFLFATTDPQKLPVTILSRCLQFNLRRLDISQISGHLATILLSENIEFEADALATIAKAADGSMRDALSLLDQAISHGSGTVKSTDIHDMLGTVSQQQLYDLIQSLISQDGQAVVQQSHALSVQGRDFVQVINDLLIVLQRIATLQLVPGLDAIESDDTEMLTTFSQQLSPELTQLFYQIALHGKRDLPYAADPKSGFEMTLLRMMHFQPAVVSSLTDPVQAMPPIEPTVDEPSHANKAKEETKVSAATEILLTPSPETPVGLASEVVSVESEAIAEPSHPSLNSNNWLSLINSLKLTALARQLADNSAFVHFDNNKVTLSIAPELAHLASKKPQERLETGLTKSLGQPIKITFVERAQHQISSTLATDRAEQAVAGQARAKDSIHNDPAVEAIKTTFNARVIESTIKLIK
ncbi:MAG: DNA polymerase-3 subunit gamma/tau [Methylophagaceae bacterium]|jgi:DNA polymerase-3 subunit gamma/tau